MAVFLAIQIIEQKRRYADIVEKYPKYQAGIDAYLAQNGWYIDEDGNCVHKV